MDASAYLKRHGWRGTGHALDNHGRGIKKPLLIAHKQDQLGLGTKKAAHKTDDQWWLRAFDESLKNIGTGQESTLSQVRKQGVNRGGLYGFFVRGEGLVGTISSTEESSANEASDSSTQPSRASTPPTSTSSEMSSKEIPMAQTAASKPSDPTKSKKRKRGEDDTFDEEAAKVDRVMKRIFRKVNEQMKKRLKKDPNVLGVPETKENKFVWEKAKRQARSDLKKEMVIEAMMAGELPNPKKYNKEQAEQNYEKVILPQLSQTKPSKAETKEIDEQVEEAEEPLEEAPKSKAQQLIDIREEARAQRRAGRQARAIAAKEEKKESKRRKVETEEGDVRYATSGEKKERKRAAEASLSVEDFRIQKEIEENQSAINKKLSKLSEEERTQYEQRAALKQNSLELYVLRRIQKKAEKSASSTDDSEEASLEAMFFTDLDGDTTLLKATKSLVPTYELLPDGSVPLDPSIWTGRDVKSLTKGERAARRIYMHSLQQPGDPVEGNPRQARRKAKKQDMKDSLVSQILKEQGLKKGTATKEQRAHARSMAKKMMKEKKEVEGEKDPKRKGKGKM